MSASWSQEIIRSITCNYYYIITLLLHVGLIHVFFLPRNATQEIVDKSSLPACYVMVKQSLSPKL